MKKLFCIFMVFSLLSSIAYADKDLFFPFNIKSDMTYDEVSNILTSIFGNGESGDGLNNPTTSITINSKDKFLGFDIDEIKIYDAFTDFKGREVYSWDFIIEITLDNPDTVLEDIYKCYSLMYSIYGDPIGLKDISYNINIFGEKEVYNLLNDENTLKKIINSVYTDDSVLNNSFFYTLYWENFSMELHVSHFKTVDIKMDWTNYNDDENIVKTYEYFKINK